MKKYNYLILLVIVLVAAFFRIYKIQEYFNFSGELGDNLLQARVFMVNNQFPLYGPPTSHPWLYFSPFYFWLLIPIERLVNYNPMGAAYLGELLGIGLILVNYLTIRKIFNNNVALVSSFFMAISPLWVSFSRDSRFYFWSVLFFYPLFYLFVRIKRDKKRYDLLLGLIWGLMLGFHYSPVIFLPLLIFCLKKPLRFLIGLVFTFIPLLIFDSYQQFNMFKNLIMWFPYRIAGFLGIYPKNQADWGSITVSLQSLTQVFGSSFVQINFAWIFLTILIVVALVILYFRNRQDPKYIFLFYAVLSMVIASLIHGGSPIHYFLPIFPVPLIVGAVIFDSLNQRRGGIIVQVVIIALLLLSSSLTFLNPPSVPYNTQTTVAKFIVNDVKGQPYSLKRIGPYDYFPENYSQNYQYLLWYYGNKPQIGQKIIYTIIENNQDIIIIKS